MIWADSIGMCRNQIQICFPGEVEMPKSAKDASHVKQPGLATHYRPIGPAAIAAALLHAPKKKKPAQKFITPRAA